MKVLDNRVRLILILLESLGVFLTIAATILIANTSPLFAGEQNQQDSVTIRNDEYQFEITVPKNWTYRKGIQPDPDEGMKSGEASFSMSVGGSEEEPENWNGIVFNSSGETDNPLPFVSVYAHEKPNQNPEEFAKLFVSVVTMYGGKVLNMEQWSSLLVMRVVLTVTITFLSIVVMWHSTKTECVLSFTTFYRQVTLLFLKSMHQRLMQSSNHL